MPERRKTCDASRPPVCARNESHSSSARSRCAALLPAGARCDCKAGESYRAIALRTNDWLRRSPMRNASNGLYNDGLRPEPNSNATCANDHG